MAKRKSNKWLYIALGVITALLITLVVVKRNQKPRGVKVSVEKVEKRNIKETVSASGKIYPEAEVKVSSDVSGEIVELYVEEGDTVKVGQLLARVNPEAYVSAVERVEANVGNTRVQETNAQFGVTQAQAQIEQIKAQMAQLDAQLANQRAIHQRNDQLLKQGVISKADFEATQAQVRASEANYSALRANLKSAEASYESAQQQVKASSFNTKGAEATLKESKISLRRTSIYATSNGIITLLNVEKGDRVVGTAQMSGTEIMRIANMNKLEVQVDVSENDVLRVHLGDTVSIEVDAYLDRKFSGVVTQVANSAKNLISASTTDQVTNFVVKIRLNPESYSDLLQKGKPTPFRPGMSASVDIFTDGVNNAWALPIQAVTTREDKKLNKDDKPKNEDKNKKKEQDNIKEIVFIAQGDTVAMKEVKTGMQDDSYIQIVEGLTGDEEVVTSPYTAISKTLKQGARIEKVSKEELYGEKKSGKVSVTVD